MCVKSKRASQSVLSLIVFLLLFGCGGGGGSGSSGGDFGTVSFAITDAKPVLPPGTEAVLVTFEKLLVHKEGGPWILLPLAQTPYTIDLLQFHSGNTTELAPPASLESGKYTQIRIEVSSAVIVNSGSAYAATVPSESQKTDGNFSFEVQGGGSVDITIDFDLSKSIVVTGSSKYIVKPVLHVIETQEAATIRGSIAAATFEVNSASEATVIVFWDKDSSGTLDGSDEEYTRVIVSSQESVDPTEFSVFWLIPNKSYLVQVDVNGSLELDNEPVTSSSLGPGDIFGLKGGDPI
jgi:hypothetical protein